MFSARAAARTNNTSSHSLRQLLAASFSVLLAVSALPAHATVTTGTMNVARMFHQASTLADGRILLSGGRVSSAIPLFTSAEIYDPATGVFTATGSMLSGRMEHGAATLKDGRVLVMGGFAGTSQSSTNTAEIYDPATGQWSATGNMNASRYRTTARLLPDGRVFVMNTDGYGGGSSYGEVFDPQTGVFTKTGNLVEATGWHGVVVLADGRVLKVGGSASGYSRRVEIWDPVTNLWTETGSMAATRYQSVPVLLPDGKVLVAGGSNGSFLNTSEIYDPATGQFSPGSTMPIGLNTALRVATPLANGNVIYTDGYTTNLMHYDSVSGQWNVTGPRRSAARETSVSLLPGGDLLLAGGGAENVATTYAAVWSAACAPQKIALSSATQNIGSAGGQLSFTVNAAPGCRFEMTNLPAWASPDSSGPWQMSTSGSMTVNLTIPANATGTDRSATFSLGNIAATITQPTTPLCPTLPTLSADVFNYTAAAGSGTVQVTAPATCPWSVSGLPSWISATSASSGTGNGSFSFNVAANVVSGSLGGARSASGQLSGPGYAKTMVFNQEANPCLTWSVNPNSISLPIGGSTGSFTINANSSCNWSLSSIPAWMTVASSLSGTGTATINYSVAANTGTPRSTTAYIIGAGPMLSLGLNQAGTTLPAPVCGTPISSGVAINGNLQLSTCPTGARGSGYYTDRYTFTSAPGRAVTILLTSPVFDTYVYLRDPSGIVIKSDDDGGGGYNSRIPASTGSFTLPAGSSGVYTIEVTSYGSGRTGAYTLNLTQ